MICWVTNPSVARGSHATGHELEREPSRFKANPDITVHRQTYDPPTDQFHEDWSSSFPDPVAYRAIHEVKYRNTMVHEEFLVSVDGHRMYIPLPKSPMALHIRQSQYEFGRFVNNFNPWGDRYDEYLQRAGISVADEAG